jgi:uncharacterized alkaline shock family protein YloU
MATDKTDSGNIKISDEAISTIAAIAAKSVDCVVDLDGGAMGNFSEMIGVKDVTKGVKVLMAADAVSIDINLIVAFGCDIAVVAASVQEAVREHIEKMTGLNVDKVNVNVNSVKLQGRVMNND